ncbi:hypothetical protein CRU96_02395 [Malaciobacter halophilus]|nr:potassium channel family protein [Malaciobacter halophilus]RYA24507.1 hypothetical protein CRU96_02395 [Malaciobacter halophilus]
MKKILSPNITAQDLWNKTPEEFNLWRREHDYPRIINYLKNNFTNFTTWMKEEVVTDEDILEFGPAIFLKPVEKIIIYELKNNEEVTREIRKDQHNVGETIFHEKLVLSRKDITPYFKWAKKNNECIDARVEINFSINSREGRKAYIDRNLELIDAGNIRLPHGFMLGGRDLEFLNMDDLIIDNCWSNTELRLWYSSAINLSIYGDLAFLNIFQTQFTEVGANRTRLLKLNNGTYQDWTIIDSHINLFATNSTLYRWKVTANSFQMNLEHSDIKDCDFKESEIKFQQEYKAVSNFHRNIKRAYSNLGETSKAGKHFYKEKYFEQQSLKRPKFHFREELKKEKKFIPKSQIFIKSYLKYVSLLFQNLLWGFGEKPSKVFLWALFIVFFSAFVYSFHSESKTVNSFIDSIYYSIVTFTTLGYGEITQEDNFLKLYSSVEAFLGLSIMALVVAGFASKSKDYS